ncbi:unnamed protein product [Vitrella brassicaformis CCMP3155]|uniref:Uncharacterized protein n=1 Tax=Vitrella brassicaformis (strain CCMP3155) TaxID=1169540 RepID=A0A0G4FL57_VITBC|nr:unnamed protein product [Vitrella brassicaformis CCMP3155]|mmetsp:Transcript_33049/g.81840  ORF Transcript_33049/g.81840 Transcript_33049/m.81840 type:complete len:82 (-) Transcript_33049:24-269(-)|eukprot:CEM14639.1 unnamed protein product [Vitrella brassicaformis CCMP3155]
MDDQEWKTSGRAEARRAKLKERKATGQLKLTSDQKDALAHAASEELEEEDTPERNVSGAEDRHIGGDGWRGEFRPPEWPRR